jgi:hypothetical protein
MRAITSIILGVCIVTAFAACKGNKGASNSDTVKDTTLAKDSSHRSTDSTMGKVPDTVNKTIPAPAETGPKAHVDSVTKK